MVCVSPDQQLVLDDTICRWLPFALRRPSPPASRLAHVYEVHARIRGARCRAQRRHWIICVAFETRAALAARGTLPRARLRRKVRASHGEAHPRWLPCGRGRGRLRLPYALHPTRTHRTEHRWGCAVGERCRERGGEPVWFGQCGRRLEGAGRVAISVHERERCRVEEARWQRLATG